MRRFLGAIAVLACVALLSSCSLLQPPPGPLHDDSEQKASAQMQRIADAVKNRNAAALKKLFSPRAREKAVDLDSGLNYFLSVFPPGRMSWKTEGTGLASDTEGSRQTVELFCNFEVSVDGKKYELYFAYFPVNEVDDPRNVGLYALGVTPYSADRFTASGDPKPFYVWRGSFGLHDHVTSGDPGVYVPKD